MVYCPKCEPELCVFGWLPVECMRCVAPEMVPIIEQMRIDFAERTEYWRTKLSALAPKQV